MAELTANTIFGNPHKIGTRRTPTPSAVRQYSYTNRYALLK